MPGCQPSSNSNVLERYMRVLSQYKPFPPILRSIITVQGRCRLTYRIRSTHTDWEGYRGFRKKGSKAIRTSTLIKFKPGLQISLSEETGIYVLQTREGSHGRKSCWLNALVSGQGCPSKSRTELSEWDSVFGPRYHLYASERLRYGMKGWCLPHSRVTYSGIALMLLPENKIFKHSNSSKWVYVPCDLNAQELSKYCQRACVDEISGDRHWRMKPSLTAQIMIQDETFNGAMGDELWEGSEMWLHMSSGHPSQRLKVSGKRRKISLLHLAVCKLLAPTRIFKLLFLSSDTCWMEALKRSRDGETMEGSEATGSDPESKLWSIQEAKDFFEAFLKHNTNWQKVCPYCILLVLLIPLRHAQVQNLSAMASPRFVSLSSSQKLLGCMFIIVHFNCSPVESWSRPQSFGSNLSGDLTDHIYHTLQRPDVFMTLDLV